MPKLRSDATYDISIALSKIEAVYQSCLNCENFDEKNELCKLCNLRPPARVIAYGCPQWEYDEIPF